MKVSLIAAMSENRVIGRGNRVPWHLPDDLKRFKRRTLGHHLIMGRKTFDSIGKPLPQRTSIVITRRGDYRPDGVLVAHSIDEALHLAEGDDEVFVAGGEEIYRLALDRADRIYLTIGHALIEGDASFPPFDPGAWTLIEDERHEADDRHDYAFSIRTYERPTRATPAPRGSRSG